jgi:hypothetical protein
MMAARDDLWGAFTPEALRTPVTILREQARLLGDKTQHLIEAEVSTSARGRQFRHHFDLVVPGLDDYRFRLFEIWHGLEIYPVYAGNDEEKLSTEAEFIEWLGRTLSSAETRRVISSLLAQVQQS